MSIGAAVAGFGMAWKAYRYAGKGYAEPIAEKAPAVYSVLLNKYYVDEGYDYAFTGRRKVGNKRLGVLGLGEASSWFDLHAIDGTVNAAGGMTRLSGKISSWWDRWVIDGVLVNGPATLSRNGLLSHAPAAVGLGAMVCARYGDWAGGIRFFITQCGSKQVCLHLKTDDRRLLLCIITFSRSFCLPPAAGRDPAYLYSQRAERRHPAGSQTYSRWAGLLVSIPLVPWFWVQRFRGPDSSFTEGRARINWIPSIGAGYVLGIDGISFLLIMLTTLLGWISILSSWTAIETRVKEYYIWFLVLQTGMLGVFMALDFFLFFVFWEAMLVPMYLPDRHLGRPP